MAKKLATAIQRKASQTARGGLRNEEDVVDLFNSWSGRLATNASATAQIVAGWLRILGHDPQRVSQIVASRPGGDRKRDITVRVFTGTKTKSFREHLISVKLLSSRASSGTNHLGRRTIPSFAQRFSTPPEVVSLLQLFTGETKPTGRTGLSDPRRVRAFEFTPAEQQTIIAHLSAHKDEILKDVFKGDDVNFEPGWMLVIRKDRTPPDSVLKTMSSAIAKFGAGSVQANGSCFVIGQILMQRKGGGRGAADLQFKCPFGKL